MNSLIITVCILIEMTVIIAKPERLSVTNSPATINQAKLYAHFPLYTRITPFTTFTTPRFTTPAPTPTPYYSRSKKSLYNYNYNTDTSIQAKEQNYFNNLSTN
ncbi:hypothetical protein CAJAP_04090 [Camponotus japonicus]